MLPGKVPMEDPADTEEGLQMSSSSTHINRRKSLDTVDTSVRSPAVIRKSPEHGLRNPADFNLNNHHSHHSPLHSPQHSPKVESKPQYLSIPVPFDLTGLDPPSSVGNVLRSLNRPLTQENGRGFPCIDYVLVYDPEQYQHGAARALFERELRNAGLKFDTELIGKRAFTKLYCPFDRLCYEAEQVQLEMDLKDCPVESTEEPGFMDKFWNKYFETDNQIDYVSGPFEEDKLALYEGHEDQLSFFRSSLRSLLVHHILTSLQHDEDHCPLLDEERDGEEGAGGDTTSYGRALSRQSRRSVSNRPGTATGGHSKGSKQHGLPYLLMKGVYLDAYILHDQSAIDPHYLKMKAKDPEAYELVTSQIKGYDDGRKDLNDTWTKWTKFQPLWKIRNYFGEKIAMYFAWQGLLLSFLWLPAFLGLCMFFYGLANSFKSKPYYDCKCLRNTTENTTVCESKDLLDVISVDMLLVIKEAFNNEFNMYFSVLICLWVQVDLGTVFLNFWKRKNTIVSYEWDCNTWEDTEPDRPEFIGTDRVMDPVTRELIWVFPGQKRIRRLLVSVLVIGVMMSLVFLTIASTVVIKVYVKGTFHCPADEPPDGAPPCDSTHFRHPMKCLLLGTFLPSGLMAVSVMVWGKVYSVIAVKLTHYENHQTQHDYQDALILKIFAFEFINHYGILFYLGLFRPSDFNIQNDGVFGMGPEYSDTCPKGKCMSTLSFQVLLLMIAKPCIKFFLDIILPWTLKKLTWALEVFKLKRAAAKVQDFAEEEGEEKFQGSDTYLERERRKPPAGDFSNEEFTEKVMQFGYVVMFAAAFPLAPFIAIIVNWVDMRVDARRLLWFNRRPLAFIASDIGMWEPILHFLNFCGIVTNGFLVSSFAKKNINISDSDRLMLMLIFEHTLFFLMYVVRIVIPTTPSKVKLAIRRERVQVAKILQDGYIERSESKASRVNSAALRRKPSCTVALDDTLRDAHAEISRDTQTTTPSP